MSHIPPSGPESSHIFSPSGADPEADAMLNLFQSIIGFGKPPAIVQMCKDILSNLPASPTHVDIENAISKFILGTGENPPLDAYIVIALQNITPPTQEDLGQFLAMVESDASSFGDPWSLTAPHATDIDTAMVQVYPLIQGFSSGVKGLANDFITQITTNWGSSGDPNAAMEWLDNVLTSKVVLAYPALSANELTLFIQAAYPSGASHGAPSTDFLSQYSPMVVYLQSLTPGTDDYNFANAMMTEYQAGWTSSSVTGAYAYLVDEVSNMFPDYPNLSEAAAVQIESIAGYSQMPLQHQLFETRSWIAGPPPLSGGDLLLAQGYLLTEGIKSLWNSGGPSDLVNWFNSWTASSIDMYMDVPLASDAAYLRMTQIVGVPLFQPTPNDCVMMRLAKNQEAFNQGTSDYNFYEAGMIACQAGGSQDNKLIAINGWVAGQFTSTPPFKEYQPLQPSTIISLLSAINYKCVLQYFQNYLTFWMGIHIPQYEKDLAEKFKTIINGYSVTHPNPNAAEFQQYIDEYMANPHLDLCLAVPGITPWHVNQLFSDLGISVPYTPPIPAYPNADYAYAGVCQILASVTDPQKEPDFDIFTQLVHQIRDAIVNGSGDLYKNNVLAWVQNIVNDPSVFEELNTDSQDVLNAILKMG